MAPIPHNHLTFLLHCNRCWLWPWLAGSHCVIGPHSEIVLLVRLQPRAHSVWCALTLRSEFSPVLRPSLSFFLHLNHITQDGAATVVAGARPGQHEAGGSEAGDHRGRGGWLWPLWWDNDEYSVQVTVSCCRKNYREFVVLSYLLRKGWECDVLSSCGLSLQ